eukprot:1001253-Rhodomonas_salina.1
MTVGNQLIRMTVSQAVSFDVPQLSSSASSLRRANRPGAGATSITVHGMNLGIHQYSLATVERRSHTPRAKRRRGNLKAKQASGPQPKCMRDKGLGPGSRVLKLGSQVFGYQRISGSGGECSLRV